MIGDRFLELYEGGVHQVQRLFETWIAAIAEVLIVEGMEANVAKQEAEEAVILVQGSLILSQGLNNAQVFTANCNQTCMCAKQ